MHFFLLVDDDIICLQRLKELHTKDSSNEGKMLRLGVETGGCSGFQYVFCMDDKKNADDRLEIACLLRIHDIMLLDVMGLFLCCVISRSFYIGFLRRMV